MDDLRVERERAAALARPAGGVGLGTPSPSPSQVGQVFSQGAIPTTVPRYFAVHPGATGGAESEGAAGGLAAGVAVDHVLVLGPRIPVAGDWIIYRAVGDRWVSQTGGGCSGSIAVTAPGCGGGFVATGFKLTSPDGHTVLTGTTDEDGTPATFDNLACGSWTLESTGGGAHPERLLASGVSPFPVVVRDGETEATIVVPTVAPGYVCLCCTEGTGDGPFPSGTRTCCPYPLNRTLNCFSAKYGDTTTLTRATGPGANWIGCAMRPGFVDSHGNPCNGPVFYYFGDNGSSCGAMIRYPANATLGAYGCGAAPGDQLPLCTGTDPGTGLPVALDCSSPQSWWPAINCSPYGTVGMAGEIRAEMPGGACELPVNIIFPGMVDVLAPGLLGGGTETLTITEP